MSSFEYPTSPILPQISEPVYHDVRELYLQTPRRAYEEDQNRITEENWDLYKDVAQLTKRTFLSYELGDAYSIEHQEKAHRRLAFMYGLLSRQTKANYESCILDAQLEGIEPATVPLATLPRYDSSMDLGPVKASGFDGAYHYLALMEQDGLLMRAYMGDPYRVENIDLLTASTEGIFCMYAVLDAMVRGRGTQTA